jgi:hypothetical protein
MELYRIIVTRGGYPEDYTPGTLLQEWMDSGVKDFGEEGLLEVQAQRRRFFKGLPSLSETIRNKRPTPAERATGIQLITEYLVRTEWEKDEMLNFFNKTHLKKLQSINPNLTQYARAVRI